MSACWVGEQEHQTFVEALRLYGRDWKKVGQLIKSRTSAQIRSHAQKYYQRLARRLVDWPASIVVPVAE